jgi:hypothetical protein
MTSTLGHEPSPLQCRGLAAGQQGGRCHEGRSLPVAGVVKVRITLTMVCVQAIYEKTLVAWFKSNSLLNIQMYNMSSLHKYY